LGVKDINKIGLYVNIAVGAPCIEIGSFLENLICSLLSFNTVEISFRGTKNCTSFYRINSTCSACPSCMRAETQVHEDVARHLVRTKVY
jgi:hypothetical protein